MDKLRLDKNQLVITEHTLTAILNQYQNIIPRIATKPQLLDSS